LNDPEIQGVDEDDDTGIKGVNVIENDNNPIPVIEEVGIDNDDHMINKEIDDEEYNINDGNNDLNSDNIKEDMLEHTINDSPSRTHYVTRRGRNIKLRKDLYENYNFLQRSENDLKSNDMSIQWSLKQGLKRFPEETKKATIQELTQLHEMNVFEPIHESSMTRQEIIGTLYTLTFIKRKRCGRVKARTCADGRPQRNLYQKWEAFSPTVRTESVLITAMVDAYEGRTVGVYDIPGAFLHAHQTDITYVKMTDEAAT
jgi:hypothetical protein